MLASLRRLVRARPVYVGGLALVCVAALATWGLRAWRLATVAGDVDAARTAVAARTLDRVAADVQAQAADLLGRAKGLAERPVVTEGVRRPPAAGRPDALVRALAALPLGAAPGAVEVYDATRRLVAWHGVSLPVDEAEALAVLDVADARPRVRVVNDGGVRLALAAWHPVRDADRPDAAPLGAVRVARVVRFAPPVQNRYVRAFGLAETWRQASGLAVEVELGDETGTHAAAGRLARALYAPDGTRLGRALVRPPSPARLLRRVRAGYDDALAAWLTLLGLWLAAGAWLWYRAGLPARPQPPTAAPRPLSDAHRRRWRRAVLRFALVAVLGWGLRYLLLALDVPGRWQTGPAPLAPLFDPANLASDLGGGLMRSAGDLLITGGFAAVFTVGFLQLAARVQISAPSLPALGAYLSHEPAARASSWRFVSVLVAVTLALFALAFGLSRVVQRAIVDSTLDFFSRTGFLPTPLVLAVLGALLLAAAAAVLTGSGVLWIAARWLVRYRPTRWPRGTVPLGVALVVLSTGGLAYALSGAYAVMSLLVLLVFTCVATVAALAGSVRAEATPSYLTVRGLVPALALLTLLIYPLVYQGMDAQRRGRMLDAARSFEEGRDPRARFALEQALTEARAALPAPLAAAAAPARLDSAVTRFLRGSLVAALTNYDTHVLVVPAPPHGNAEDGDAEDGDAEGDLDAARHYAVSPLRVVPAPVTPRDRAIFREVRRAYAAGRRPRPLVTQLQQGATPAARAAQPVRYVGLVPLPPGPSPDGVAPDSTSADSVAADGAADGAAAARRGGGWVLVQATPRALLPGMTAAFPRVLLPDGSYRDLYARLTIAIFRDGVMARALGREFERATLPPAVRRALALDDALWRVETEQGRRYLTYYRRYDTLSVVAVRIPAVQAFDHLYYLLRLIVAGLGIGAVAYLMGLALRYRRGLVPAPRVRFRDKVLNAFLVVGVVTVLAVGVVGVQVVTGEGERFTEQQLADHLTRVEDALALEAPRDVPVYRAALTVDLDSLAARVGLDLSLFADGRLLATSRPRLVQDRFVEPRLPADVYHDLYVHNLRSTTATAQIGGFTYTVGYRALADRTGTPRLVVAVPTLPQQERIVEEQARTLAYLFGALLLLLVVVVLTALLIANALARPLADLRAGLEAVGEGRFTRELPVTTRDEIGQLVQTFNETRAQLAESRRKLAQQERKLAWREMARQVAHEIKNPLTPMKLSVQHLRRAFARTGVPAGRAGDGSAGDEAQARFASLFDRVTSTLIEQIGALARIANEFSTFARLPTRVAEPLNLSAVAKEAVALMEAEDDAVFALDFAADPLVVSADREELRRLYINLLKNALQAIPADRAGRIEVATARTTPPDGGPSRARTTVTDNGTGIAPAQRDKIFQPNFSTKTSGTGLGLAIARKSVEELGGAIGFETEVGTGTTFWVELPLDEG